MKKFKFGEKVLVKVPYKSGYVVWRMYWSSIGSRRLWLLEKCPVNYSPMKVEKYHKEYLNGKRLHLQLIRAAAASHNWDWMKRLRASFDHEFDRANND